MPVMRRLTAQDYDAVIELWKRSGPPSVRPGGRDSREAFARQLQGGQIAIGLEDAGRLIGVVVATHDTRKGWINRLAIDPAYRRRGLGTMLHRAAEQALREAGMQILAVLVEDWNGPSMALLRKEGYRVEKEILYFTKRSSPEA
jgi:ribosomal protein S18 acetylase RimI-like enzyme